MKRALQVLLVGLSVTAHLLLVSPHSGASTSRSPVQQLETATPIKHFVSLMQENHSFDNYFGTYPGADGIPEGTCMPVDNEKSGGPCVEPFSLTGKPVLDLGHTGVIHERQYNNGKMDGFISAFNNQPKVGETPMGYYDDTDIPYYWNVADQHVLFDRAFTSAAGGSVWNHFYWVTGTPGNPKGDALLTEGFDKVPTIFDRLEEAGVSWKFYVQNYDPRVTFRDPTAGDGDRASQIIWVPLLNYNRFIDDPELNKHIVPLEEYFADVKNGTLPAVSYIAPSGTSEHPPGSIQSGMRSVRNMINALMMSSSWDSSAFMWTYDDWGGWYDHVPPPAVDEFGYGFRAPALLVSAYSRVGQVNSTVIDFTSQLKFIENNWGVAPLSERDRNANDITSAFDFTSPPREPILISEQRNAPPVEPARTVVVYTLYGGAMVVPPVVLLVGVGLIRRRSRRTAGRRGRP